MTICWTNMFIKLCGAKNHPNCLPLKTESVWYLKSLSGGNPSKLVLKLVNSSKDAISAGFISQSIESLNCKAYSMKDVRSSEIGTCLHSSKMSHFLSSKSAVPTNTVVATIAMVAVSYPGFQFPLSSSALNRDSVLTSVFIERRKTD